MRQGKGTWGFFIFIFGLVVKKKKRMKNNYDERYEGG